MIAAIDIGGTKIAVGIVGDNGRVLARAECATDAERGYKEALSRIEQMLRGTSQAAGEKITGIGIGSTGPVDPFTGEFGEVNFFPNWRGENLVQDLAKRFHVKAAMENDADASALGEAGWGAGRNKKRLIYVTVGTGIGVGVILDGHVYRGVDGAHPEIGHCLIDASGPPCSCGFQGCWESLAAGPALAAWFQSQRPQNYPHPENLSAKQICGLAFAGDALALQAAAREAHYLGLGLANLVTTFAPDSIVLGGSVMKSASLFLEEIRRTITRSCRYVPFEKAELALASLGEDANLIGAARVWHHRFAEDGGERG
ncbi:MAG TPA: ROK family protein [Terriglobales bacterium]|nr:ROK family protein [Terriglobales bacterium]